MIGLDLLTPEQPTQKVYGMVIGIVTNNRDPNNWGRVKVKFPWLADGVESNWARIASPMAGGDRGLFILPEVDDEVLVAFLHGNVSQPYVLGALWNGKAPTPIEKKKGPNEEDDQDPKNDLRIFKSRNGNKVIFDDAEGKERIIVQDKLGKNKVVMQDTIMVFNGEAKELTDLTPDKAQITLNAAANPIKITVGKDQDLLLEGTGNITFKSPDKDFAIECKNFSLKTSANTTIEAGGATGITGDKTTVEGKSGMDLKCSSGVKVNSSSLEVS